MDAGLRAVTVHRFAAAESESERLAEELTAFFEDRRADLPGLRDMIVLVAYGVGRVAVIAGWESRDAQIAGDARLRTDPALLAITSRAGFAEHDEYRVAHSGFRARAPEQP